MRPNIVLNRRYRLEKRTAVTREEESYQAYDSLLHRPVTVVMPVAGRDDLSSSREAFVLRYQLGSSLHYRNIVAVLDVGEDHGRPYAVLEYFVGETLAEIIANEAPFDIDDVVVLVEQLAKGLEHARQRGIVHGALSPEEVIVDAAGLAKMRRLGSIEGQFLLESGSREPVDLGPYSPLGLRGNTPATHALDVHALAAIAYEMLTGNPPVMAPAGEIGEARAAAVSHPSRMNPTVPERAGDMVLRGLRAYGGRSELTALQFSQALTQWRSPEAPTTPQLPNRSRQVQSTREPAPGQWQGAMAPRSRPEFVTQPPLCEIPASEPSRGSARLAHGLFLLLALVTAASMTIAFLSDGVHQPGATPEQLLRLLGIAA